jgi:hypothetical protein
MSSEVVIEPFSSCVAVGFDVVQDEDGLHDRGRAARATAQLGEDLPGFEGGDRAAPLARQPAPLDSYRSISLSVFQPR